MVNSKSKLNSNESAGEEEEEEEEEKEEGEEGNDEGLEFRAGGMIFFNLIRYLPSL